MKPVKVKCPFCGSKMQTARSKTYYRATREHKEVDGKIIAVRDSWKPLGRGKNAYKQITSENGCFSEEYLYVDYMTKRYCTCQNPECGYKYFGTTIDYKFDKEEKKTIIPPKKVVIRLKKEEPKNTVHWEVYNG